MDWSAKIISHKGSKRIAVYFEKNADLIARIKLINGSRWSQSLVAWHLPDTDENRERFGLAPHYQSIPSAEGIENIEKLNNGCAPNATAKVR